MRASGMSIVPSPFECRTVLVLGGARSGKSAYAQSIAEAASETRIFLATAEAGDAEMADRIARHRADRGAGWSTREEPLELVAVLEAEARAGRVVLVDCITLWLSNLLFAERDLSVAIAGLAGRVPNLRGPVVFVSNEVGEGIAPATSLGREFRDWQGRANQALARACDVAISVQAGLPRQLKPAPEPRLLLR